MEDARVVLMPVCMSHFTTADLSSSIIGDDYFSVTVTTAADIEIDLTILVLKAGYTNQLTTDTGRFWVY